MFVLLDVDSCCLVACMFVLWDIDSCCFVACMFASWDVGSYCLVAVSQALCVLALCLVDCTQI